MGQEDIAAVVGVARSSLHLSTGSTLSEQAGDVHGTRQSDSSFRSPQSRWLQVSWSYAPSLAGRNTHPKPLPGLVDVVDCSRLTTRHKMAHLASVMAGNDDSNVVVDVLIPVHVPSD